MSTYSEKAIERKPHYRSTHPFEEQIMFNLRSLFITTLFAATAVIATTPNANAQDRSVWLHSGESATVEGYFLTNEAIQGSCDSDCSDLDLFLYDASGNLVSQDVDTDSAPVVIAPYEGYFTIEVGMPSCSHNGGCAAWVTSDNGF